jgi:hypothetical protein
MINEMVFFFGQLVLASSTTKTGRHDIAEILLKVASNTKNYILKMKKRLYNSVKK